VGVLSAARLAHTQRCVGLSVLQFWRALCAVAALRRIDILPLKAADTFLPTRAVGSPVVRRQTGPAQLLRAAARTAL